jgi:hypothetical protein
VRPDDRQHEVGLGTDVVGDRGVVGLTRRLCDLPVGHLGDAVLDVEPFGRFQQQSAGARTTAAPHARVALTEGVPLPGGHAPSSRPTGDTP